MEIEKLMQRKAPPTDRTRAKELIDNFKQLKGQRSNFEGYWQSLHNYFYVESANINKTYAPGAELNFTNLYDTTSLEASDVLASGFMNYLTPPSTKWFRLRTKNPNLLESKAVSVYLQDIEAEVYHMLNKSNFYGQIHPSFKSSGVYGTSILLSEEDVEEDIRFYNLPIKQCCIVEDGRGRVAEYYIEFEYSVFQVLTRFGEDKLTQDMKLKMKERDEAKKYPYLLYIGQRGKRDFGKQNKKNLPIEALWIDVNEREIIDVGGYNEFPAFCHRFDKQSGIAWGFSPAMKALPMARIANAIAKTNLRAMMKHTDPPMALPDNSFIMPFNANPRAINYYKKGTVDQKGVFAFANQGNPEVGLQALMYYNERLKALMFNDVFLAFNGLTKQMNNPEIMERINEKMTLLGPAVGRHISEVLDPLVIRTIGVGFRRGKFPDPPDEMIDDPRFEIEYVSALAQAQKRTELNGLMTALGVVGQMAQFAPETLDRVNPDKVVDSVWGMVGAEVTMLRDDDEVKTIRENRMQQQAQMQQIAMAQEGAKAAEGLTRAEGNLAKAEKDRGGGK